jgi:predicted ATPase
MINELSFTNFKSWQSVEKMRLAPITGLFGTNSSGKTSILQLLLMLKQTVESTDRAQVLEFGDEKSLTNLGSFRETVYGHAKPGTMTFGLQWSLPYQLKVANPADRTHILFSTEELAFHGAVGDNGSDRLAVSQLEYSLPDYSFRLTRKGPGGDKYELDSEGADFRFVRNSGRVWDLPAPVKFHGFPDQVYAYYQNAGFLAELQLAFEDLLKQVYYLGPLRDFPKRRYDWAGSEPADMGRRGERVVDALLAARQRGQAISPGFRKRRLTLEQRVASWLKELGLIHSFSVEPVAKDTNIYRVWVQKTSSSAKVLITDVGFGVSQILPVLVLCYYVPEGSIILLEQPEIHLHPSVQSGLADVFIDAAKNRNVQIVVESHSEYLLRRLQRRVAEQLVAPEKTALYFCEMENEGSKLVSLNVDIFGNITNWPKDFFGDEFGELAETTKAAMERKKGMPG